MRGIFVTGFAALFISGASADEVKDALLSLEVCYMAQGVVNGAKTCQPPPMIVGAVFGDCSPEEDAFEFAIQHENQTNASISRMALEKARERYTPRIESQILSGQTTMRKCP